MPTDAEWEYAAAGGDENRLYPWGSQAPDGSLASFDWATLAPVGSSPAGQGRWGQHDLAGSMWEWTLDMYHSQYYSNPEIGGTPCDNCANVDVDFSVDRMIRGGAFSYQAVALRAATRTPLDPVERRRYVGFRCAR